MKTLIIPLFLFLISMSIFSCQPNNENLIPVQDFPFDQIGMEHNKGLDYVLNYLKSNKQSILNKSKKEFFKLAEEGSIEFLKYETIIESTKNIEIATTEAKIAYDQYIKHDNVVHLFQNLLPLDKKMSVSDFQTELLSQIEIVIDEKSLDLNETLLRLQELESKTLQNCPIEEQFVILTSISIAKSSLKYWHDNFNEWTETLEDLYDLPSNAITLRRWFSWKAVAKNDIAYGAGGAVAGAIVGGSVTVGVATLPGYAAGAIGGAIGGSVGNAAIQVLDRIW